MEKMTYASKNEALKAIAVAYLSSIGFFNITKENFSVSTAYTWQIKDVLQKYNQFADVVLDTLKSEEQGFYIVCYERGYHLLEDLPENAFEFNLGSFEYLTSEKYLNSHNAPLFLHYTFDENCEYTAEKLTADEMREIVHEYAEYFCAMCK